MDRADQVYDAVTGAYTSNNRVAGVENLFEEGKICDCLYSEVYEAAIRVNQRLGQQDDPDVDLIIHNLLRITKIVGCKMYGYGLQHGKNVSR